MNKKTVLSASIGLVLGGAALAAHANLTSGTTLSFVLGTTQVVACTYGTTPPCANPGYNVTDVLAGSWFAMDINSNGIPEAGEKAAIGSYNGIVLGATQAATGSHSGSVDGSESPNIDMPWTYYGGVGMHQTTSPITATGVTANGATLDMSGWNMTWFGIPDIPLTQVGTATMSCTAGSSCSDTSSYALDAVFHVNGAALTTVAYYLHLEGHVSNVPVPAAAWLFGSGLVGLAGVARRRKTA